MTHDPQYQICSNSLNNKPILLARWYDTYLQARYLCSKIWNVSHVLCSSCFEILQISICCLLFIFSGFQSFTFSEYHVLHVFIFLIFSYFHIFIFSDFYIFHIFHSFRFSYFSDFHHFHIFIFSFFIFSYFHIFILYIYIYLFFIYITPHSYQLRLGSIYKFP